MLSSVTTKRIVVLFVFGLLITGMNSVPVQAQSGEYGSELLAQVVTQLIEGRSSGSLDWMEANTFETLLMSISQEYESLLLAESAPDPVAQIESENDGAVVWMIPHNDPKCRIIGLEVGTDEPITSCFWGHKIDATKLDKNGNEIDNMKIIAFEEIYIGGTYANGEYLQDGYFVGKFRKFFKAL